MGRRLPRQKKSKSRSPSPKKGDGGKKGGGTDSQSTPPPPSESISESVSLEEVESEEEKEKKRMKEKMKIEFFSSVTAEEEAAKTRLDLIRIHASGVLQDLRNKAEAAYKDMEDWLGARFLKEMESIDHMSQLMRNSIEQKEPLKEEIQIFQEDFLIRTSKQIVRSPTPPPRPMAEENILDLDGGVQFTVQQLSQVHQQLINLAPSGRIATRVFVDMLEDLTSLTAGEEILPDKWMDLNTGQLEAISQQVAPFGEHVEWLAFLIGISKPWPTPSQRQLLKTLRRFRETDDEKRGTVTFDQYKGVPLWWTSDMHNVISDNPNEPYPYDRTLHIQHLFFTFFTDQKASLQQLDYENFLFFFCMDPDPFEGFTKALALSMDKPVPNISEKLTELATGRSAQEEKDAAAAAGGTESTGGGLPKITGTDGQEILVASPAVVQRDGSEDKEAKHDVGRNVTVTLDGFHRALHHGDFPINQTNNFYVDDPEDPFSKEKLSMIFEDVGGDGNEGEVPLLELIKHPTVQDIFLNFQRFKAPALFPIVEANPEEYSML